jgi:DNA-binding IclR family transcriptional regulator
VNPQRIVAELADSDAWRLLLAVEELGGQVGNNQAAAATGFTPTYVHKLTRRLSRYGLVMPDQRSLAEEVDLTPLAREVAAHLR